jgi:outer membrane protein TolC
VNQTAPELAAAYRNPLESQAFAVSINSPLVLWGAHSADVQAAQADRDRITSSNTVLRAQSAQNALFAALGLGQSRRVLIISAKADTVGAKRYEVAYNRYVIGRIGFDVLYLAQQEKDAALQAYVSALRAYWQAYYSLRLLTLYDFEKGVPIR